MSVYYEKLANRDLWVDGQSSLSVDAICDKIFCGENLRDILSNNIISGRDKREVDKFLKLVPEFKGSKVCYKEKTHVAGFDTSFDIDEKYKNLGIEKILVKKIKTEIHKKQLNDEEVLLRIERIQHELELYKNHGLTDVLSACLYIVDTFRNNNIVWGPGRGSACCSYVLYLIGIHNIDSVAFDLQMDEFLR